MAAPSKQIGLQLRLHREVISTERPKEFISKDLQANRDAILAGINIYKKRDSSDKGGDRTEELKKLGTGPLQAKLLLELSELLDLGLTECKTLFSSWILAEYRQSREDLKNIIKDERLRFALLERLNVYYYTDRSFSLYTLKYVIAYAFSEDHPDEELYRKLLSKDGESNDPDPALFTKLLELHRKLYETKVPQCSEGPLRHLWTPERLSGWCYQLLREQVLVLESLILLLYYEPPPATHLRELLFQFKNEALTGQYPTHLSMVISSVHQPLLQRIQYLQMILPVVCMNIWLIDDDTHSLNTAGSNTLMDLNRMFNRLGDCAPHGPLLLGWAVYLTHKVKTSPNTKPIDSQNLEDIGLKALSLNPIQYMCDFVNSLQVYEISDELAALSIYSMISRVLMWFDDSTLDDSGSIATLLSRLFQFPSVTNLVMLCTETDGVLLYMRKLCDEFPLYGNKLAAVFHPFAKSSNEAAKFVVNMMRNLNYYTDYVDQKTDLNFVSDTEVELVAPKTICSGVRMSVGTLGRFVTISDGPPSDTVIQWSFHYNAWDMLSSQFELISLESHSLLDLHRAEDLVMLCRLLTAVIGQDFNEGRVVTVVQEQVYNLIHNWLLHFDIRVLMYGAGAGVWLQRLTLARAAIQLSRFEYVVLPSLCACLSLLTRLSRREPASVIENLVSAYLPTSAQAGDRPMYHVLYSAESAQNRYPCLIETLKIMCTLISKLAEPRPSQSSNSLDKLTPSVLFVLQDVFISHTNWRYDEPVECDLITEYSLELIHQILDLPETSSLRSASLSCILNAPQTHRILRVLSLGSDILNLVRLQEFSTPATSSLDRQGPPSTVYRISLSLSIVRRLIYIVNSRHEDPTDSALTSALSARYDSSQQEQHITAVVASYTNHRFDSRLATLSTQLLTALASRRNLSLLSSLGSAATQVKLGLLHRLSSRAEEPRLKTVIVELLTTCVDKQPAMLEFFVQPSKHEDPLLKTVESLIDSARQFTHVCPAELLLASFNLILSLWVSGHQTLTKQLAENASFWVSLTTPLKANLGDVLSQSMSHPEKSKIFANILQILSYQLYSRDEETNGKEFTAVTSELNGEVYTKVSEFILSEILSSPIEGLNTQAESPEMMPSSISDAADRRFAALNLLDSWHMFISVMQHVKSNLIQGATKATMLKATLGALKTVLTRGDDVVDVRQMALLSELTYKLILHWYKKNNDEFEELTDLTEILQAATGGGALGSLQPAIYVNVVASLKHLIASHRKTTVPSEQPPDAVRALLHSLVDLIPSLSEKINSTNSGLIVGKLRQISVSCLHEVIMRLPQSFYLSVLRENYTVYSLLASLAQSIQTNTDSVFNEACLALCYYMAQLKEPAKLLQNCITEHITLTALRADQQPKTAENAPSSISPKSIVQITKLFSLLLNTLKHTFVPEAADYLAVTSQRFEIKSSQIVYQLSADLLSELKSFTHFLSLLSLHKLAWASRLNHQNVNGVLICVAHLYQDCIALLQRPKMIQHLIGKSGGKQPGIKQESDIDISTHRELLVDIVTECLKFLRSFSPELTLCLMDPTLDLASYLPLVQLGFSAPALDNRPPPTFGCLMATCSYSISLLTRSERSPSRAQVTESEVENLRPKLLYMLDNAMLLAMTQSVLFIRSNQLDPRDIRQMKRDLSSELSSCLGGVSRYYRKLNPVSPAASISAQRHSVSPPTRSPQRQRSIHLPIFADNDMGQSYYELVDKFVKTVLK